MKPLSFFTLCALLVVLSNAAPIPSGPPEASGSGSGKGKGRSPPEYSDSDDEHQLHELAGSEGGWTTPPSNPLTIYTPPPASPKISASGFTSPHTSHIPLLSTPVVPATSANIPLPGRSGVHHNPHTGVSTAYYGDDELPEHMGHLQRNHALHSVNSLPYPRVPSKAQNDQDRRDALRGIGQAGKYRNSGWNAARDHKPPSLFNNPHKDKTTTAERLPNHESVREGLLLSSLEAEMRAHDSKGQIRANPGWLTPHQRIAHEAPARLNTETRRPGVPAWVPTKKKKPTTDPEVLAAEAKKKEEGYTPIAGDKNMRPRKGVPRPPPPVKKVPKQPKGKTNLVDGRITPPGHLWHPNNEGASHAGAPVPLSEGFSNGRHPPRPQNPAHVLSQKLDAHIAEKAALQESHPHAVNPHPGPAPRHPPSDPTRFAANLARFNTDHPAHTPAHGARPAEAPARLQHTSDTHTHVSHHDAHHPAPHNNAHTAASHHDGHATTPHHDTHTFATHHDAHAHENNAPSTSQQVTLPHHPAAPQQGGGKGKGTAKGKGKGKK